MERGLTIPIIYNTSSYDALSSLSLMDGLVDIVGPLHTLWLSGLSQRVRLVTRTLPAVPSISATAAPLRSKGLLELSHSHHLN